MKQWKKVVLIVTIIILTPLYYNYSALAQNVLAGVDLWETRPGDTTFVFGGSVECPPIPADFFEPGSEPFEGQVAFQGQPLQTIPSGILGSADTIVKRLTDAVLSPTGCPSSDTVDIEIVALSLVSVQPITVGGFPPALWDVEMCLSSGTSQPVGSKTINKDCDEGGTFTAVIPVIPKFIFTRVDPPHDQRILDYGLEGIGPIYYDVTDGHWLYNDLSFNVLTSPGGLLVDHDCNGVIDAAVGPGSNFYPGLEAVPCDCSSTPTAYNMVLTLWQSPDCGNHGVYPPQAQQQPTIYPQIATECPVIETFCPAIETVCPEWGDTYCPQNITMCPKVDTICANEWTYCPQEPTWCPYFYTECPMEPTFCDMALTQCQLTMCEYIPTFCPEEPTWCPIHGGGFTICPYNYTWCPDDVPTECPMDWTNCPAIPTVCPDSLTVCPEVITECPTNPTVCEVTECPHIETSCPTGTTWCPYAETSCPTGSTWCPTVPTICPMYDKDYDTVYDVCDNCPDDYNPGQEDTMPPSGNGCGDLCECEGDFEPDGDVDGTDAVAFKNDFFRKDCAELTPCNGDFECDGDVDGTDAVKFKADFFRKDCPSCTFDCY